ncbi:MAG: hypothetical protein MI919_13285 [Holophagales bacterium]|nr:hypothetical protein [Holophagales bacterium]
MLEKTAFEKTMLEKASRHSSFRHPRRLLTGALLGCAVLLSHALAPPVAAQFVEPEVEVLFTFVGEEVGDAFGWVSETIGDIDGDGVQDLIISAPSFAGDGFGKGRAYVFSGAAGTLLNVVTGDADSTFLGFSVNGAGDVDGDGVPDYLTGGGQVQVYSGADHTLLLDLTAATGFAHDVSSAGDVDADGHDDLFVGSQNTSVSFPQAGRVLVLSGLDGSVIWSRDGAGASHQLGSGTGLVGDVNGDGIPDVVAGAMGAGPNGGGEAFVLSGVDGSILHTLSPDPATAAVFGQFFASGAGDVNRDGVPDVYVGDYNDSFGGVPGTGRAYVFSGRSGRLIHDLPGPDPGDGFGDGRGAGDVNGDGFGDLIIAGYTNSDGAPQAGKAYVYSGRSGALLRTITATVAGDSFGVDATSVGDVDGDGEIDYLVTSVGLSFLGQDVGRAFLLAGTPLPCVSDLNGNGWVGLLDLWILKAALGSTDSAADLDGDGDVDIDDLRVLLRDLGRCPQS